MPAVRTLAGQGAARDEIAVGVARRFGFKATGAQLRAAIERQVDILVAAGELTEREGVLSVPG